MFSRYILSGALVSMMIFLCPAAKASQPGIHDQGADRSPRFIPSIAFDGKRIVVPEHRIVRLWDAESGQVLQQFEGYTDVVRAVDISPDGKHVLTAGGRESNIGTIGADYSVHLWDVETGEEIKRFEGHTLQIQTVQFSEDGERVLSAARDGVRVWEVRSGEELFVVQKIGGAEFRPDGRALVALVRNTATVFDATNGEEICRIEQDYPRSFKSASVSPDGRFVVTRVPLDGALRIWDGRTGELLHELVGHEESVHDPFFGKITAAVFTGDGRRVVSGSSDQTIRMWDSATGEELTKIGHPGPVRGILLSPDGKRCFVKWRTVDDLRTLGPLQASLWDLESGKEIVRLEGSDVDGLVGFAPDGKTYLTVDEGKPAALWSAEAGEMIRAYHGE